MSQDTRIPREHATLAINIIASLLRTEGGIIEALGSYRRGKETIGDVDMLALPSYLPDFLKLTDELVERGIFKRGRNAAGSESWGTKKRLIQYMGIPFDVALATPYNMGYIKWLRTGPGEANTILMSLLSKNKSMVRMDDGYLWYVTYHSNYVKSAEEKKRGYHKLERLNIPTEDAFFAVLGMPYIPPEDRSEISYRRYLGKAVNTPSADELSSIFINKDKFAAYEEANNPNPKQKSFI